MGGCTSSSAKGVSSPGDSKAGAGSADTGMGGSSVENQAGQERAGSKELLNSGGDTPKGTEQMISASSGMDVDAMEAQAKKLRATIDRRRRSPGSTGKPQDVNAIVGHYEAVLETLEKQIEQIRAGTAK